jgi:predicted RNA-binding Zn-ribbon protein involved in translation (DUF1610 family)
MAAERRATKWDGDGTPEGEGGMSVPVSAQQEVQGRKGGVVFNCWKCGAECSIPEHQSWFTCWKCGSISGII